VIPDELIEGGAPLGGRYCDGEQPPGPWPDARFGPLLGPSLPMRRLFTQLARIAPSPATVLVQGETGTGKELVARALHEASPRARGPFVILDCGALPESLLEAELFGHARGAFTGATQARAGAIEAAHGGTLFLDEIGELPVSMQPRVLRALESRLVRRLGETEHRRVDVRFVCATHRDLRAMIDLGTFREDLYFRVAVLPVQLPALRERRGDILPLLCSFLPPALAHALTPELADELTRRPWAGNVRELRNFAECAAALGLREASQASRPARGDPPLEVGEEILRRPLSEAREWVDRTFERRYLLELLDRHGHNVSEAARAAGVGRTYLHRIIARHRQLLPARGGPAS
jgi:DNA-binding NtrC family response regulator